MNTMSCEKHLGMGTVQNCAPCLQVELDYVRSEIEALRADKAMLDWIIGKFCLVGVESLPRSILGSRETISAAMESENTAVCER